MNMLRPIASEMAFKSPRWLQIVMEDLETPDCELAIAALRSTLHALRDRIGTEDATQLGAHLPFQLRGVYYENWQPSSRLGHSNDVDDFFGEIACLLPHGSALGAEAAASATFSVDKLTSAGRSALEPDGNHAAIVAARHELIAAL